MSKLYPELVFTRGPQKGRRVALAKTMNIVGRDATCDVEVQDDYASRQHARIIVEGGQGSKGSRVRLVNTSPNGTRINGRPAEQAVLADGDLIGIGLESEARFEAVESETAQIGAAATKGPAAAGPAEPEEPKVVTGRRFKKPSLVAWVAVYLAAVFGLFAGLKLLTSQPGDSGARKIGALTDEEIRKLIDQPLKLDKNGRLSGEALARALRGYDDWLTGTTGPGHLYATLLDFKLALAYRGGEHEDFGPADTYRLGQTGEMRLVKTLYDQVKAALAEQVISIYRRAYIEQRQGHWQKAGDTYHELLQIIRAPADPVYKNVPTDPIYKNVLQQLNVVNANRNKEKGRYGSRV